jgi:hypothetical protein
VVLIHLHPHFRRLIRRHRINQRFIILFNVLWLYLA